MGQQAGWGWQLRWALAREGQDAVNAAGTSGRPLLDRKQSRGGTAARRRRRKGGGDGGSGRRGADAGEEAPGGEGSMGRRRPCSLEPEDAEAMTRDLARLARQEHVMTRQKGMMGKRSWRGRRRPSAVRLGE